MDSISGMRGGAFLRKGKKGRRKKTRSLFRGITGVMSSHEKCNGLLTGTSLRKNALTQSHFSGAVAIIAQWVRNQRDGLVKSLVHCLGSIILNNCPVISYPVIALCSCCQFLGPSFEHSGIPRAKRSVIKDQTSCPTYITDPSNVYCIALHFLVWRACLYCAGNTSWFLSIMKMESISGYFKYCEEDVHNGSGGYFDLSLRTVSSHNWFCSRNHSKCLRKCLPMRENDTLRMPNILPRSKLPVNRDDLHNVKNDVRLFVSFPGFAASVRRVKQEHQTPWPQKTWLLFILASLSSGLVLIFPTFSIFYHF